MLSHSSLYNLTVIQLPNINIIFHILALAQLLLLQLQPKIAY